MSNKRYCNICTNNTERYTLGGVCTGCKDGILFSPIKSDIVKEHVNHPDYYNKGIEAIKFIESWDMNFSRGSVIKYVCRAGLKDSEAEIKDLKKAKDYIDFEIERIKRGSSENNRPELQNINNYRRY